MSSMPTTAKSTRTPWAGDMSDFLSRPLSAVVRASGVAGYEHYVRDPFIEPDPVAEGGREGMAAIGSPEKVTEAIKELEQNHVIHFISYLDDGGLSNDEISGSLRLFSEKVMPNFR